MWDIVIPIRERYVGYASAFLETPNHPKRGALDLTKHEFLAELTDRLSVLPEAERDKAAAFYAEMIDDSMEDGMDEDEAIAKLGSIGEIAERIISAEVPMDTPHSRKANEIKRRNSLLILLAIGFPIWFPILMAASAILLSLFVVLWVLVFTLWVVFGAGAVAALASVVGLLWYPEIGFRLLLIGGAMAFAGCAALLYPASLFLTKRFAYSTHWIWGKLRGELLKRRGVLQ